MVTVVFLYNDFLYSTTIDYNEEISFGSNKKDDIKIKDFDKESIKVKFKDSKIMINAKKAYDITVDDMPFNSFVDLDKGVRLFIGDYYSESPCKLKLPYDCIINFGRSSKNDVVIAKRFISGSHFVMRVESGNVHIEDLNSTNGLYLNGKKVTKALMKSGDFVQIFSVVISLTNGELSFINVGDTLTINEIKWDFEENLKSHISEENKLLYKRSPRTQAALPSEEIILAAPPTKASKQRKNRGMFSALAGSGAMMAAGMIGGLASPALIAARAAGLVSPIASVASSRGNTKANKKELEEYEIKRREKYGEYIDDQKAKIGKIADLQREIILQENPEPKDCFNILFGLRKNLWERSSSDKDFLSVRVGMGYQDLCVPVKAHGDNNSFQMESDEVRELTEQIIEETRIVDSIPSCINLLTSNTIGFVGNRKSSIRIVKNMLVELSTSHCFDDIKFVGIFDEEEKEQWEALRWLPHFNSSNGQSRFIAFDSDDTHALCESLNEMISDRKKSVSSKNIYGKVILQKPFCIFIIGSKDLVKKEEIMSNLLENDPNLGITSLFLFDDIYMLPNECRYIVDVDNGPCYYEKNQINNKFYFTIDESLDAENFDLFTRRMSAVELDGFAVKAPLPDGITFLEGYGVKTVEELNVGARWEENNTIKSMAAPIGVLEGGKPFYLDVHSKAHGSHGLAAGTTGSGKSELLQTWILSMAINYHPHEVNFVIIDYKGGGMADLMEPLPHVVGKITNIDKNINRTLVALNAEAKRRQQVFSQYEGVNNIEKYLKLYKEGIAPDPMPHLIIVSDEFAELKKEEPDFMTALVSIARVGRSLGVHLLLATQNPSGVVDDQIQSNSHYRLCLKVNDAANSREMLKRPDAASITQAGRCFVRIGEDEYFDEFQSYWSGAKYSAKEDEQKLDNRIRIIKTNGNKFKAKFEDDKKDPDAIDELTAITKYIVDVATEKGIKKLNGPWLPELPDEFCLSDITEDYDCQWLQIPIGLYDIPELQAQGIQSINFQEEGHYGIYGAPGTGKTTLLKTIVMSACLNYSPKDINFYLLDFGGWSLNTLADLPHVGGVALEGEDEKFVKFEQLISTEIERRKKLFLKNAVSSLDAYRSSVSDDLPAIVVMVDNFGALFEVYPDLENLFNTISTTGTTYGIYLVFTATSTTGAKYKIIQNVKGAIAFELTDKGDYSSVVGRLEANVVLPKVKGRAFFKNQPPIEFQTALYARGENDKERSNEIKRIAAKLNSEWTGSLPKAIPVMPETITYEQLASNYNDIAKIPVGYDYTNVAPAYVDLSDNYGMVIAGSDNSANDALLINLVKMVNDNEVNKEIFIFDSGSGSLHDLEDVSTKYVKTTDESVDEILKGIVEELNCRKKDTDGIDDKGYICIVIDDIKQFVDDVTDDALETMERVCRLAKGLKLIVLAAGTTNDMLKYSQIESLTRTMFSNQKGIILDGTPAEHSYFVNNLKYSEKENEAGEGNAFLIENGNCVKIKIAD